MAVAVPGTEEAGAGKGLRAIDPERYGDLHHPGDAYAYDIYTQVARALRDPGAVDPLDGLERAAGAGGRRVAVRLRPDDLRTTACSR